MTIPEPLRVLRAIFLSLVVNENGNTKDHQGRTNSRAASAFSTPRLPSIARCAGFDVLIACAMKRGTGLHRNSFCPVIRACASPCRRRLHRSACVQVARCNHEPPDSRGKPMRKMLLTSAISLLGLAAIPASAMPVAPLSDTPTSITLAAMGCGPGFTRGPYGHCHPIHAGVVVAPAPGVVVAPVPRVVVAPGPYRHCWIGPQGHRHCN